MPFGSHSRDPRSPHRGARLAALGGVIGPVVFIATWGIASAAAPGYSPREDAISELAAVGAGTRSLMTGGFVAFALCVLLFATALRSELGGRAWMTAAGTGVGTLLVAAIPLGHSPTADHCHGIVAVCGYAALAVTPLLAIRPLLARPSGGDGCVRRGGGRVGDGAAAQ